MPIAPNDIAAHDNEAIASQIAAVIDKLLMNPNAVAEGIRQSNDSKWISLIIRQSVLAPSAQIVEILKKQYMDAGWIEPNFGVRLSDRLPEEIVTGEKTAYVVYFDITVEMRFP